MQHGPGSSGCHDLVLIAGMVLLCGFSPADAAGPGECDPCDVDCDLAHDALDVPPFADALLLGGSACAPCAGDMDGNGVLDGQDIQPFIDCVLAPPPPTGACCTAADACIVVIQSACGGLWMGAGNDCSASPCAFGNLTAHRPQRGGGYFPFAKTAVAEADEQSAVTGPGIRINAPGDSDPAGEDDLIELLVENNRPEIPVVLRRAHGALRVWSTRNKLAGTEIVLAGDRTGALATGGGGLTLWVEWAAAASGEGELHLEPLDGGYALDMLRFHTFSGIVMALGGEDQVPSLPVDPNHGTFVVATALYGRGYDVFVHDEDDVSADGSGAAYNEVVTAVRDRQVDQVAIYGYSHGGGSTHDLAERLDINRPAIGVFEIVATSYVDAVENDSDFDVSQELRRPPASGYHANHYQVGSLADFFLDGGPVPNSDPPPTGLNVQTTPWGASSTHFQVDDYVQVRSFIEANLTARVAP